MPLLTTHFRDNSVHDSGLAVPDHVLAFIGTAADGRCIILSAAGMMTLLEELKGRGMSMPAFSSTASQIVSPAGSPAVQIKDRGDKWTLYVKRDAPGGPREFYVELVPFTYDQASDIRAFTSSFPEAVGVDPAGTGLPGFSGELKPLVL